MSKMKLSHNLSELNSPRISELEPGELFVRRMHPPIESRAVYMVLDRKEIKYPKPRYQYAVSLKSGYVCALQADDLVIPVAGTLDVREEL